MNSVITLLHLIARITWKLLRQRSWIQQSVIQFAYPVFAKYGVTTKLVNYQCTSPEICICEHGASGVFG